MEPSGLVFFLMISGMLIADKVYSGRFTSWSSEILRRYLKLTCPLTVTFLLAYLFYRGGLFYTVRVAPRLENEWLSNFYSYLPGGLKASSAMPGLIQSSRLIQRTMVRPGC